MKYSIKISLILFIMYSFLGCKHKTKQEHVELKNIPLQLENKVSFGHFLPQRELAVLVDQEKVKLKNIPKEFIDYMKLKALLLILHKSITKHLKMESLLQRSFNYFKKFITLTLHSFPKKTFLQKYIS